MFEKKNEIAVGLENDMKNKVVSIEDTMTEEDIWEWNLLNGIGNDIY